MQSPGILAGGRVGSWDGMAGANPSIPEKYRTGKSEVSMGAGKKRFTQRINVMDLWDHPELLGGIPNVAVSKK